MRKREKEEKERRNWKRGQGKREERGREKETDYRTLGMGLTSKHCNFRSWNI